MALARLKLPAGLVGSYGRRDLECRGQTVGEALRDCIAREPRLKSRILRENGDVWVGVFLNGRNVRVGDGMDSPLKDGDEISLMAPVAGG
jgi:sulfur-carrier protein